MSKVSNTRKHHITSHHSTAHHITAHHSTHPLALALMLALSTTHSAQAQQSEDATTLDAITVTARLRAESIQDVPDSIVAFSATDIDRAGIEQIQDIANMVPNVILRKGLRSAESYITIRGITSGRQGWPPVAFVVDGVKASSLDAMEQGTLLDVEQIEVLKGPQGALYGAGAIGGAINIVTRRPSEYFEGRVQASYGRGNHMKLSGNLSGPIIENTLMYSVSGFFNEADGVVRAVNLGGKNRVDALHQKTGRARLLYTPSEDLSFDLRASTTESKGRSPGMFDTVSDPSLINEFRTSTNPGPVRRAGFLGNEQRKMHDVSLKVEANLGFADFQAVLAYQDIDQTLYGATNTGTGVAEAGHTIFGQPTFGNAALPGQIIDEFQNWIDNLETSSADFRLTSNTDSRLRWLGGAELMRRKSLAWLSAGHLIAPEPATRDYKLNRWDRKIDNIWGVYGQVSYDITDRLELTLAGRYDRDNYRNRNVPDRGDNTPIPVPDINGNLIDELKTKDSAFTPKVQLSYSWTKEFMTYVSYSEGYRFGFYTTGNHARAESTKNYEIGFKSRLLDNTLTLNGSAFHIDYSDQQYIEPLTEPPFRRTINTPETKIDGFEIDAILQLTDKLSFSAGAGYTEAIVQDATRGHPAVSPRWTTNTSMQWVEPLSDTLDFTTRLDYRHQSSMYIRRNEAFPITGKTYVDFRIGFETLDYSVKFFVDNLLDTQQALSFARISDDAYIRTFTLPRTYGVELRYNF